MTLARGRLRPAVVALAAALGAPLLIAGCADSEQDNRAQAQAVLGSAVTSVTAQAQDLLRSDGPALLRDPGVAATSIRVAAPAQAVVYRANAAGGTVTMEVAVVAKVDSGGGLTAEQSVARRCLRLTGTPSASATVAVATVPCPTSGSYVPPRDAPTPSP